MSVPITEDINGNWNILDAIGNLVGVIIPFAICPSNIVGEIIGYPPLVANNGENGELSPNILHWFGICSAVPDDWLFFDTEAGGNGLYDIGGVDTVPAFQYAGQLLLNVFNGRFNWEWFIDVVVSVHLLDVAANKY